MRRMRRDDFSRRLMRETRLTADDLIQPVFVMEGKNRSDPVPSMPGISRVTPDLLLKQAEKLLKLGVPAIALFPVVPASKKDNKAKEAYNPEGLVPRTVSKLKKKFPELGVITDIALDPYTSHGQQSPPVRSRAVRRQRAPSTHAWYCIAGQRVSSERSGEAHLLTQSGYRNTLNLPYDLVNTSC